MIKIRQGGFDLVLLADFESSVPLETDLTPFVLSGTDICRYLVAACMSAGFTASNT